MLYRIIVITGPLKGQQVTVEKGPMTIGRDPECTVCVPDEELARKHAVLEHREDGLFIRDLGSMNKILANKHEVREARLKHGDVIELGRTRFLVQASVQAEVSGAGAVPAGREFRNAVVVVAVLVAAGVAGGLYAWRHAWNRAVVAEEEAATEVAAPPVVATAAPAPRPPAAAQTDENARLMSEELQRMHKDLADIRASVRDLAAKKPEPAPAPSLPSDAAAKAETLRLKAEAMLAKAQKEEASGNVLLADQLLDGVQILDPDYGPAYEERARLYERRGLLEKAGEQWQEVANRSPGTPLHERAMAERVRLGKAAREVAQVRIADVESFRLPASDEFDERRILRITLAPGSPEKTLDVGGVRVDVLFYDTDEVTGEILPTRAVFPAAPLKVEGTWAPGQTKVVKAMYVLPKGFLADEAQEGRQPQYYGYMARVYYYDQLQDQNARPKGLLDSSRAK